VYEEYKQPKDQYSNPNTLPQRPLFCERISVTFDLEHFGICILYLEISIPYTECYSLFPVRGECTRAPSI